MSGEGEEAEGVDLDRVALWLELELEGFYREDNEARLTAAAERRAFFIAWMAVFLPEAFSSELRKLLETRLVEYRYAESYRMKWYRTLGLESAAYALGGPRRDFERVVVNIDHGNSNLRPPVLLACALVVEKLDFEDYELRSRVDSSLRSSLGCCTSAAAILIAAKGSRSEKQDWAKARLARDGGNPRERDWLTHVAEGLRPDNPMVAELGEIGQYALSVLARPNPGHGGRQRQLEFPVRVSYSAFFDRMRRHPLLDSSVDLGKPA